MLSATPQPATGTTPSEDRRAAWHTVCFSAYCLVFLLIRVSFATSLTPGDAVEHYLAQGFALSYGVGNPPLHTWLFIAFERALGPGLLTAQLLDALLLIVIFASLIRTGRLLGMAPAAAAAGAWSLFLVPPLIGSLALHTQEIALACIAALTFEATARVTSFHRARDYVGLGVILAVGSLTKYVYLVLPAAIAVSVIILARWRRRWVHAELVYTLLPPILLWPVLTGLLGRVEPELANLIAERVAIRELGIQTTGAALSALVVAVGIYIGPLALAFLFCRPWRRGSPGLNDASVFISHAGAAALGLMLGIVIVAGVTDIAAYDLHVVFMPAPIIAAAWIVRPDATLPRPYLALIAAAALLMLGKTAWDVSPACPGPCEERIPYAELAKALGPLPDGTTVVASDALTAGNLRVFYPEVRLVTATFPWEPDRPATVSACIAVVDPRARPDTAPGDLLDFSDRGADSDQLIRVGAPGWPHGYEWRISRADHPAACP